MANIRTANELDAQSEKLYFSYLLAGNVDDIQEAVHHAQKSFDLMHRDDGSMPLRMPFIMYNLARSLFRKFMETRQVEDITTAIEMLQHAHAIFTDLPDDNVRDKMREKCFHYLVISGYVRDGNLDEFLRLNAPDVLSPLRGSSVQIKTLTHNLEEDEVFQYLREIWLHMRQISQASPECLSDLDSAIQLSRQALAYFCSDPLKVSLCFFHLGTFLLQRSPLQKMFQARLEDNNEAIYCLCSALRSGLLLQITGACLLTVSEAFVMRYEAQRTRQENRQDPDDLDNAFKYIQQAVKIFDAEAKGMNSDSLQCLQILARIMWCRCIATDEVNREVSNLSNAIEALQRGAIASAMGANFDKISLFGMLTSLHEDLKCRADKTAKTLEVFKLAIESMQKAVHIWPPNA